MDRTSFIGYDQVQRGIRDKSLGGTMGQLDAAALGASETVSATSRSLNNRRSWIGDAPTGLGVLGLGAVVLAVPVALRSASVTAPTLRAALETMITLFAFAAAWLLRTQFCSSRRLRDLLLLAATLVLGLTNFAVAAVPAALDLGHGAYFATAQLWSRVSVGAMFAVAAFA
ncbi:MAG: hypothetical protein ACRDPA_07450, partial [Solirubrobacteraceae bacterium]